METRKLTEKEQENYPDMDYVLDFGEAKQYFTTEAIKELQQEFNIMFPSQQSPVSEESKKSLYEILNIDSKELIGRVRARYQELKAKRWEWKGFYNGWLEGRADLLKRKFKTDCLCLQPKAEHDPDICGCENHSDHCPNNPSSPEYTGSSPKDQQCI